MAQRIIYVGEIKTALGSANVITTKSDGYRLAYEQFIDGTIALADATVDKKLYVNGYSVGQGTSYKANQLVCAEDVYSQTPTGITITASSTSLSKENQTITLSTNLNSNIVHFKNTGGTENGTTSTTVNGTYSTSNDFITINGSQATFTTNSTTSLRNWTINGNYNGFNNSVNGTQAASQGSASYRFQDGSTYLSTGYTISPCITSLSDTNIKLYVSNDGGQTYTQATNYTLSPSTFAQNTTTADITFNISAIINNTTVATVPILQTKGVTAITVMAGTYIGVLTPNTSTVTACYNGSVTPKSLGITYTENFTITKTYAACLNKSSETAISSTTIEDTDITATTYTTNAHSLKISTISSFAATGQSNVPYTVYYDDIATTNYNADVTGNGFSGTKGYITVTANSLSTSRNGLLTITSTTDATLTASTVLIQNASTDTGTTQYELSATPSSVSVTPCTTSLTSSNITVYKRSKASTSSTWSEWAVITTYTMSPYSVEMNTGTTEKNTTIIISDNGTTATTTVTMLQAIGATATTTTAATTGETTYKGALIDNGTYDACYEGNLSNPSYSETASTIVTTTSTTTTKFASCLNMSDKITTSSTQNTITAVTTPSITATTYQKL